MQVELEEIDGIVQVRQCASYLGQQLVVIHVYWLSSFCPEPDHFWPTKPDYYAILVIL